MRRKIIYDNDNDDKMFEGNLISAAGRGTQDVPVLK